MHDDYYGFPYQSAAKPDSTADEERARSMAIGTWGYAVVAGGDHRYDPEIELWFTIATEATAPGPDRDTAVASVRGRGADFDAEVEAWFAPAVASAIRVEPPAVREHLLISSLNEAELVERASRWLTEGLLDDELVILLGDPDHVEAVLDALPRRERASAESRGLLVTLDVRTTLALVMRDGLVDDRLFEEHVTASLRGLSLRAPRLRAYGNMAGVLWADGNVVGALDIDSRWTALQSDFPLAILCSYPIETGPGEVDPEVCAAHAADRRPAAAG